MKETPDAPASLENFGLLFLGPPLGKCGVRLEFKAREGVVFIGIAQEKARVPRTIRKGFGEAEDHPVD